MRWECSNRSSISCKRAVTTDIEIWTLIRTVTHTLIIPILALWQPVSWKHNEEHKWYIAGYANPDTRGYYTAATTEIRAALGNTEVVKRTLRRQRAKHLPQNPQSPQDLVVEDQWITTGGYDPHTVFIYDNGVDSPSRMNVFVTDEGLTHLACSDVSLRSCSISCMSFMHKTRGGRFRVWDLYICIGRTTT